MNDGAAAQRAHREAQVRNSVTQPSGQPHVAHVLLHLHDTAELEGGLTTGFSLTEAATHQVLGAAIEVVSQFAIEVALHSGASNTEHR